MLRQERERTFESSCSVPRFQIRARQFRGELKDISVWQLSTPSVCQYEKAKPVASLSGSVLKLVDLYIRRRLTARHIKLGLSREKRVFMCEVDEDLALFLALLFKVLAPMRDRDNIRYVVQGIEAMEKEEAAYWMGMVLNRKRPSRVLAALRTLLTPSKPQFHSQPI